ncbi:MAG: hypothetical protein IJ793_01065 [Opitutales bacterium]|nr:hypothetical protein [Opitutales bacterium]
MSMKKSLKYLVAITVAGSACTAGVFGKKIGNVNLFFFCHMKNWERLANLWGQSPKTAYEQCLREGLRKKLNNTHLYILLSSYKQAKTYGEKIVNSMEANAKNLADLGVTSHIIVRCDGEKTENGEDVISGDLWTYAKILNEKKIAFKVHETEGVKPSDFVCEKHNIEDTHWELVANETNLGCSGTRHASIDAIEEEVNQLREQGKYVYIGIFDGDDWVHEDFYPVLLLNALRINAPVSNYNGRMGAHGLEGKNLRKGRLLGTDEQCTWTLYTDMESDDVDETLSKQYAGSGYGGECYTTKIFEADYFYERLNSLWQKMQKDKKDAKRDWIELRDLTLLDGFCSGACTCTTEENLFHYTQHK